MMKKRWLIEIFTLVILISGLCLLLGFNYLTPRRRGEAPQVMIENETEEIKYPEEAEEIIVMVNETEKMEKTKFIEGEKGHFGILLPVPLEKKNEMGQHIPLSVDEIEEEVRRELEDIKEAGAVWIRPHPTAVFNWGNIDIDEEYNWTIPDLVVKLVQEYDMQILIQFWNCPKTIKAYSDLDMSDIDLEKYLEWLKAMVERYDGDGIDDMPGLKYPVLYYEVLNEPIQHNPEEETKKYVRILRRSYEAIKEANSSAKVLVGGLLDVQRDLPLILEEGGADYFDIINWHQSGAEIVKQIIKKYGIDKSMWITEIWYEPIEGEEREEVIWLVETLARNFAMGVDKIFHVEIPRLLGDGEKPKPAYYVYKLLASKIGRFESAEIRRFEDLEIYEFIQDGRFYYIILRLPRPIKFRTEASSATIIDLMPRDGRFDEFDVEVEGGFLRIEPSEDPLLIEIERPLIIEGKPVGDDKGEKGVIYVSPGEGPGPGPEPWGPWNHRLLIAISEDGLNWRKLYRIISDQASVPDVIVDREGYVRVYYVDVFNKGITLAMSRDLVNWTYIKVEGIETSWQDPSIVILPDGRYRMYASLSEAGVERKIVSAISEDGIHFRFEGVVFESDVTVVDPDVIYADGVWVMYLNVRREKDLKIGMLMSEDGLNFKMVREYDFHGAVPCLIRYGDGYRLYLHKGDHTAIVSFYSRDLETWDEGVEVLRRGGEGDLDAYGVEAPAVARLENGTYVMIYVTMIEAP